jgi:transposase
MAASVGAESDRWCIVLIVVETDGNLVLVVEPTRVAVACPHCGELSRRQHSRYERHPLDLPWRGKIVRMRVHSRRWFCDTPSCPRKIFAERFDGALARYARRTNSATELLTTFALQAGGEGGAVWRARLVYPSARTHSCGSSIRSSTQIHSAVHACWVLMMWPCGASSVATAPC